MTYDVLIAGGGNAALCAAICAAREGASVLVVEAAPKAMRGGNTRHTRNCRIAHDEGNGILTGPYPVEEYLDDLLRVTKGNTDLELAEMTLQRSTEVWDFLEAQGVRFQPSLGGTLSLGRTNAFFLGGGRSMLNALCRTAEDLGVAFRYATRIVDLRIEDGFFLGATLEAGWEGDAPTREAVAARTFVAAAGGFESNIDWLKEGWGEAAENFLIRGTPYNTGSILRELLDAGADKTGDVSQFHSVAIDGRAPKFDGGIITRLDCVPFGIVVNQNGTRFYDEGEDFWPKRYAIWGRLVAGQPDQVGHVIIDAKSADLFMPSAFPPETDDTLDGLARKIGLPVDTFLETVDAFNAACVPGDFDHTTHDTCHTEGLDPPKSHWARPLTDPPFRAYTLRPGITFTYMGVRVNRDARVLFDGAPSPNIFATGEIMAGNILGEGYLGGLGMTIGTVFGRIAGTEAAKALSNERAAE